MRSGYVITLIVLAIVALSNAFPRTRFYSLENHPEKDQSNANLVRREDYDPYGFNSILSRFYKRTNAIYNDQVKHQTPEHIDLV